MELSVGGVVVVLGGAICSSSGSVVAGSFLRTLGGRRVGIFGLVGPTLTLGRGFLGRLRAGSHFGVSVATFGIGGLSLDGFATLLGSGFGGSGFVVVLGVSVGSSFGLGFLGRGGSGGIVDACATQELLLDGEEAGIS